MRGNDDRRNRQGLGQFAGVQTSGAAERDESKIARIVSALDGDNAQRTLHVCVHHSHHARGELFETEA